MSASLKRPAVPHRASAIDGAKMVSRREEMGDGSFETSHFLRVPVTKLLEAFFGIGAPTVAERRGPLGGEDREVLVICRDTGRSATVDDVVAFGLNDGLWLFGDSHRRRMGVGRKAWNLVHRTYHGRFGYHALTADGYLDVPTVSSLLAGWIEFPATRRQTLTH